MIEVGVGPRSKHRRSGLEKTLFTAFTLFLVIVAALYLIVSLQFREKREARDLEHLTSAVERASFELQREVSGRAYADAAAAPDETSAALALSRLHTSVRELRELTRRLEARMDGGALRPDAAAFDRWLAARGFLDPPESVASVWRDKTGAAVMSSLLKSQAARGVEISMKRDLTLAEKRNIAAKLETMFDAELAPKLAALRTATTDWHDSAEASARFAAKASVVVIVAISFGVLVTFLLPAARRAAERRAFADRYAKRLAAEVDRQTAALRDALTLAEASSNAKSAFLKMISHETRTPLNGVLGAAEVLDQLETSSDAKPLISAIRASGGVLLRFIDDWTEMADYATNGVPLAPTATRPDTVLREVVALYEDAMEEKGLAFFSTLDAQPPALFELDGDRLARALRHMVENAVNYTTEGFVSVTCHYRDKRGGSEIFIQIADTGSGMTKAAQAQVLNGTSRLDPTRENAGSGVGLGIAHAIIDAMDGRIELWSRENVGTIVTIYLPAKRARVRRVA